MLNDSGRLRPETRQRVRDAIAALHFTPNAQVRSLRERRTSTIGLLCWRFGEEPEQYINGRLLHGIQDVLWGSSYDLLLYSHRDGRWAGGEANDFLDNRVDGLIWSPVPHAVGTLEHIASAGLPTVALFHDAPPGIGSVRVDNEGGGYQATEHLIRLGHRRIGFMGAIHLPDFQERRRGYLRALSHHGVPPDPRLVYLGKDAAHVDHVSVARSLRQNRATGVVCTTDEHALLLIQSAATLGIRIPEHLAVVGFDNAEAARASVPPLTTVSLPAVQVGRRAAFQLLSLLEGRASAPWCESLPVNLVVRGSTLRRDQQLRDPWF